MLTTILADLRAALRWLGAELRLTAGWCGERELWLALALGLALGLAAYAQPRGATLHVGGDASTRLRLYDAPFLSGFNASEPDGRLADWAAAGPYRWATPESQVRLPGLGGGVWRVQLLADSGRPDGGGAELRWADAGGRERALALRAQPRTYHILASADAQGDLALRLRAPRLEAPGDRRELGFVLRRVVASPLAGAGAPAPGQLATQAWCGALLYMTLRRARLRPALAALAAALLGLALALLLAGDRMGLTIVTPALGWLGLACALLAPLAAAALAAAARRLAPLASAAERDQALAVGLAAFVARMVGALHPYAQFSDLGFNVNNLARVVRGNLLLTGGLPCEAGAGVAPYPPAQYLTLAPALLLADPASGEQLARLVQGGSALLEGMGGALLIWLLLRALRHGQRAALAGAALYVLPAPLLSAYRIGEMANVFAQALVPALLLLLALWPPAGRAGRGALLAGALAAALLLSHTGVAISAVCMAGAWALVRLARDRAGLLALALAGVAAAALAAALLYSAYLHLPAANRAAAAALAEQGVICPPGRPLATRLQLTLGLGFGPQGAIAAPLALAALAGALARARGRLAIVLAAAALGGLLSLATLLTSDQPVRWAHFLFPAIAVAAGLALGAWARRGRAGAWMALALLAALLWGSGARWAEQIADYLH